MEDNVTKIKDRLDIIDLIGSYIKLQKAGINYKARCPFHNEKSGSFFVSPERQIWHCFGCNMGGDMFTFVERIEGVEFREALRILANRAGVELSFNHDGNVQQGKAPLLEIAELSTRFFQKQLHESETGKRALAYLHDRGLTDESIQSFRLGFAPDQWQSLGDFIGRRYSTDLIAAAGMTVKKDAGGHYDRFRSRIMFPIADSTGQIVGFTGRVFDEGTSRTGSGTETAAKYVNTPQSTLYDKSRVLYGLDKAKLPARHSGHCVLVEGNMDVIMSHQAGVPHTVAASGTALTEPQLVLIKRYADTIDMCFDADEAGTAAMDRGVMLALARGLNVNVIPLNERGIKDPADYVKAYGTKWAEVVAQAVPFMEHYFKATLAQSDISTGLGKKMFSKRLLPFVAALTNRVEQAHWINEIALTLKVKEDIIEQELSAIKLPKPSSFTDEQSPAPRATVTTALPAVEEDLLSLIFKEPSLAHEIPDNIRGYLSQPFFALLTEAESLFSKRAPAAEIVSHLTQQPSLQSMAMNIEVAYLKCQELWQDTPDNRLAAEFHKILGHLKRRGIMAALDTLQLDIRQAEQHRDAANLKELVARFSALSRELVE